MQRRTVLSALAATALPASAPASRAARWSPSRPLRVQMVLFDGVAEQDFIGPNEALTIAGFATGGAVAVSYVTSTVPRTVKALGGTKVVVDRGWSPPPTTSPSPTSPGTPG